MGKILARPCRNLYNTSGTGGYVFVMSMLSGYPVGAKLLADFTREGLINRQDAKTVMAYSSTSGPMFIVGSVGSIMLFDKTAGYIILVAHYLSAIVNGLLYRSKYKPESTDTIITQKVDNILSESVYSAVISVMIAGAYVAIFYTCATMLQDVGVISAISKLLNLGFKDESLSTGLAFGLVEMTGGCLILSKSTSFLKFPIICAVISFGGLSVSLQSMTFLETCGIKPMHYLLSKITQSILAFILCFIMIRIIYPFG